MSKKGENIYKRKDGRWEGRYIRLYDENGKAKYGYVYGKNYSDVKQRLLEKKAYSGSQADMASKCSALYSEVLDAWLQSTRRKLLLRNRKAIAPSEISPCRPF